MDASYVIECVGWFTKMKSIPPMSQEEIEMNYRFFENYISFLQEKGLTTREILKKGEKANDDSQITFGDLTEEGFEFFKYGIIKWRIKVDRARNVEKAINDFAFIEKKWQEFKKKRC
ncbi:cyclopropane-fatty-acyl-phospholipid synthase [Bacteroides cellulosilyticus]|uniref:cyclopropane-fatty-acyl-phospholipid synthase n=1 Tax=Bacteroides cellulosilyticus TaxID=246787 RepID=UPI0032EBDE61